MKQKIIILCIITFVFGLVSCNNEENLYMDIKDAGEHNIVNIEEAKFYADLAFAQFFGDKTRTDKKLSGVEMHQKTTRSNPEAIINYIILNYADDGGFILLSADSPKTIYGISDKGELHLADTIWNPGINWFLNEFLPHNQSILALEDTMSTGIEPIVLPKITTHIYSEPLLKGVLTRFRQEDPYNQLCPIIGGVKAPVGCVPLAVGTIMGYYRFPAQYGAYSYPWERMLWDLYNSNWGRLFKELGNPENLNVIYGSERSSALLSDAVRTFTNFGYKNTQYSLIPLTHENIGRELERGRPVIVGGDKTNGSSGHVWIIDGGKLYTIDYSGGAGLQNVIELYYHCIWGFGDRGNGYFLISGQSIGGTPSTPDPISYGDVPEYLLQEVVMGYEPNIE